MGIRTLPSLLTTLIFQDNILIDQDCNARLADFGLITISDSTSTTSCGGTYRWMSPELLDQETPGLKTRRRTGSSDCYALGMVVYEVLSGRVPFYWCHDIAAVMAVLRGERPKRPESGWFTDGIWNILEHCWKPESGDRPSVSCVLQRLEEASGSWTPHSSLMTVVPREAPPMRSHSGSVIGGGTGVTHSGQPSESTGVVSSEPV